MVEEEEEEEGDASDTVPTLDDITYTGDGDFFENLELSPFLRPKGSPVLASTTDKTVWNLMQRNLREIEQVMPRRAKHLAENEGWTLVDVRPLVDYCEKHCWGAKSCQYFVPLEWKKNFTSFGKQAISLAMFPERVMKAYANVVENEDFVDEIIEEGLWGEEVILYDDVGGVIGKVELNFEDSVQTPSLMAAHELIARGFGTENVKHMAGGLPYWDEIDQFDIGTADITPQGM